MTENRTNKWVDRLKWFSSEFIVVVAGILVPFTILSMVAIHYWVKMSRFPGQKAWEMAPGALAE